MTNDELRQIVGEGNWEWAVRCRHRFDGLTPRMWAAIVRYANTGDVEDFRAMVTAGLLCMEESAEWIEEFGDTIDGTSVKSLAARYHAPLRNLLKWQSDFRRHKSLGPTALKFQMDQCAAIKMSWAPNTLCCSQKDVGAPSCFRRVDDIDSTMAPVCWFIREQADQRDEHGVSQRVAIPIRLCASPDCGKFFPITTKQARKLYCEPECRQRYNEARRPAPTEAQRRHKVESSRARRRGS